MQPFIDSIPMTERTIILVVVLLLVWGLGLCIALYYSRMGRMMRHHHRLSLLSEASLPPVTVIICVRDQCELIHHHLLHYLTQDYPSYEVLVVDMGSSDDTKWLLLSMEEEYSHLRHIEMPTHTLVVNPVAEAQMRGTMSAKHEWLLFASIDSMPASPQWLRYMGHTAARHPGSTIVAGITTYQHRRGADNARQRFVTLWHTMMCYIHADSHRLVDVPGGNVMVSRDAYMEHDDSDSLRHYPVDAISLMVNRCSTAANTSLCLHPEARILQLPPLGESQSLRERQIAIHTRSRLRLPRLFRCWSALCALYPWLLDVTIVAAFLLWPDVPALVAAGVSLAIMLMVAMAIGHSLPLMGECPPKWRLIPLLHLLPLWAAAARAESRVRNRW